MSVTRVLLGVLIVVVGCHGLVTARQSQQRQSQIKPLALVGGSLIDGTGGPPVRNSVVLIRGNRIEKVGTITSLPVPGGYDRISTDGMTVLPGLWDMHVHTMTNGHGNYAHGDSTYTNSKSGVLGNVIMPAST